MIAKDLMDYLQGDSDLIGLLGGYDLENFSTKISNQLILKDVDVPAIVFNVVPFDTNTTGDNLSREFSAIVPINIIASSEATTDIDVQILGRIKELMDELSETKQGDTLFIAVSQNRYPEYFLDPKTNRVSHIIEFSVRWTEE